MKTILLFTFIFLTSCSSSINYEEYLSNVNIKLSGNYNVIDENISAAAGDLGINFRLRLEQKDFETIKNKIIKTSGYKEYSENVFPNNIVSLSNEKIIGYKRGKTYYYEVSKKKSNENYIISLTDNRNLEFSYIED